MQIVKLENSKSGQPKTLVSTKELQYLYQWYVRGFVPYYIDVDNIINKIAVDYLNNHLEEIGQSKKVKKW